MHCSDPFDAYLRLSVQLIKLFVMKSRRQHDGSPRLRSRGQPRHASLGETTWSGLTFPTDVGSSATLSWLFQRRRRTLLSYAQFYLKWTTQEHFWLTARRTQTDRRTGTRTCAHTSRRTQSVRAPDADCSCIFMRGGGVTTFAARVFGRYFCQEKNLGKHVHIYSL